jgi:hypothetical protein
MYYALAALSIGGLVLLRRRRVPIIPLLAVGLDVCVSVALTFGQTRYRSTFEIVLVLAAAVQLDWVWSRFLGRRDPSVGRGGAAWDAAGGGEGGAEGPDDGEDRFAGDGPSGLVTPVPTGGTGHGPR